MIQHLTEMIFILDRSGSMHGLEADTIGGYNELIKKQIKEEGNALVTTVLFDHSYELLVDGKDIHDVPLLTSHEYFVRGSTALLDAIGKTIEDVGNRIKYTDEHKRPHKVIMVITTDGYENASVKYSYKHVRYLINRQKEKYNWEFVFLGANIAAEDFGEEIGIGRDFSSRYHADKTGVKLQYEEVSKMMGSYRKTGRITKDWKQKIDEDYENRK